MPSCLVTAYISYEWFVVPRCVTTHMVMLEYTLATKWTMSICISSLFLILLVIPPLFIPLVYVYQKLFHIFHYFRQLLKLLSSNGSFISPNRTLIQTISLEEKSVFLIGAPNILMVLYGSGLWGFFHLVLVWFVGFVVVMVVWFWGFRGRGEGWHCFCCCGFVLFCFVLIRMLCSNKLNWNIKWNTAK